MPKLKTHKGAKSRFKVTGNGKLMRAKCGKSHFRRRKAPRTKRMFDGMVAVAACDVPRLSRLMPYA
ncbi:MAG: 50S ribosomal protein L35 [Dehalococcoidia bacterium]|nr:50S ribosomal protein L35 [Dehalococcoidia bacterium]